MPISIPCPVCGARLKAPDAAAGRTLKCPGCLAPVQMPGAAPPQTPPPPVAAVQKPPTAPPAPKPPPPPQPQEQYPDFEIVDDGDNVEQVEVVEEELDEVVAVGEDEVEDVEEVVEADELDEVVPVTAGDYLETSRLLGQREILIRARKYDVLQKYIDQDLRDYELCVRDSGKRLGRGREVRDAGTQVARLLVGGAVVPKRLEITEGRDDELLATVKRSPMPLGFKKTLEISDGDDRPLALFERTTWAALTQKALWISSPSGKKRILKMKPQLKRWRYLFLTPANQLVAELIHVEEERGIRIHWVKLDASSFYLRFRPCLDSRPRDKLLCLAVALGLEA